MIVEPGIFNHITADGVDMSVYSISGSHYCFDIEGLIRRLGISKVEFSIIGSPLRGIRGIRGKHEKKWEIIDPRKAWLYPQDHDEYSVICDLEEFRKELRTHDIEMKMSAAKTFASMSGRIKWLDPQLEYLFRRAYIGGMQYSSPGVYLHTETIDISGAYQWAMLSNPLPSRWSVDHNCLDLNTVTPMTAVSMTVSMKPSAHVPLLPFRSGRGLKYLSMTPGRRYEGIWMGPDIIPALDHIESAEVNWILRGLPDKTLSEKVKIERFSKKLKKKLSLAGYGMHAQGANTWTGVVAKNVYDAIMKFGSKEIPTRGTLVNDGEYVWWTMEKTHRPYVRIDWAALVTARARRKVVETCAKICESGEDVVRVYVDSITATDTSMIERGVLAGEWKDENSGPAVIGPPGVCHIGGKLKRSGLPADSAHALLNLVINGTYMNRNNFDYSIDTMVEDD